MAQNHNGSEPFVACGEKGQKGMWGMELWGKSNRILKLKIRGGLYVSIADIIRFLFNNIIVD